MFVRRAGAHHYLKVARFNHEPHLTIVKAQQLRRQGKFEPSLFSCPQCDALKSLQLFDGPRDAGGDVSNIELHDLITGPSSGVLDFNTDSQRQRKVRFRADLQVAETKLRVAESVSKRIEWRPASVKVFRRVFVSRISRPARIHVIVIKWFLAHAAGKGHRQLASGVCITE